VLRFVTTFYFQVRHEAKIGNKKGLGKLPKSLIYLGTEGRNRTGTMSPSPDFESDSIKKPQHIITKNNK
jgi:hypothetical protein